MDLLTLIFRLPFLPLRGFIRLAQLLEQQAQQEFRDPSNVRRQLEEAAEARDAGRLSDDELSQLEYNAVGRMIQQQPPAGSGNAHPSGEER